MAIGTSPGVMELHVLRICVCWGGEVEGGGGTEFNLLAKAISTVDFKLALSNFTKSKSHPWCTSNFVILQ